MTFNFSWPSYSEASKLNAKRLFCFVDFRFSPWQPPSNTVTLFLFGLGWLTTAFPTFGMWLKADVAVASDISLDLAPEEV